MINKANFLIIAGMGRNVGKTTLACKLINQLKGEQVIALKITPHFHESGCKLLYKTEHFTISIEENNKSDKDTSKMLQAGASVVYYIQANDESLPEVLGYLLPKLPLNTAIICESGALRNYIKPSLFIVLSKTGLSVKNPNLLGEADLLVMDYLVPKSISFVNGTWKAD